MTSTAAEAGAADSAIVEPSVGSDDSVAGVDSAVVADPDTGIGYSYVTNRLGIRLDDDPREVALRQAVYDCAAAG